MLVLLHSPQAGASLGTHDITGAEAGASASTVPAVAVWLQTPPQSSLLVVVCGTLMFVADRRHVKPTHYQRD